MDKYTRKDFDNVGDMLRFVETCGYSSGISQAGMKWAGGRTLPEAIDYIRRGGDPRETERAQKLVNKIDATFRDRSREEWTPAPYGAYPVVPDYLAGDPFSMRTKVRTVSDIAAIKLVIEQAVNNTVTPEQAMNRAAAVAALAQRLSEMRPVELWLSSNAAIENGRRQSLSMVKLDASPVNVGQLIALFSPSGLRMVKFVLSNALMENRDPTMFPFWVGGIRLASARNFERYNDAVRERMGLAPQDIYVPLAGRVGSEELCNRPEAWVNKQLEAQREISE